MAEPAIMFIHGQGFHLHYGQELIVTYVCLLLVWVKAFGASLASIRSAEILCTGSAFALLWLAVKRLGLVAGVRWRLVLMLILSSEFGMIFAYRLGRYDGFGVLLMAAGLRTLAIQRKSWRLMAIGTLGAIVPWAGLQYVVLLAAGCATVALLFGRRYGQEIGVAMAASVVGGGVLTAMLWASGRLAAIVESARAQHRSVAIAGQLAHHGGFNHHNYLPKDFSFPFLLAAAAILWVAAKRSGERRVERFLSFSMVFAIVVSAALLTAAKFPSYYAYMVVVPLAVAISAALGSGVRGKARAAAAALCVLSALAGAGLDTVAWAAQRHDHQYWRLQNFAVEAVHPEDIAWVDPTVYLAVAQRARDVWYPYLDGNVMAMMSERERAGINVIVVTPADAGTVERGLGGTWRATGESFQPIDRPLFGNRDLGFVNWRLSPLVVYRRV